MSDARPNETLYRVLIAAESLFAENGYDGTTLRQITQLAKVNLAAVNYHHGDKESLYLEIIRRRLQPINQSRLRNLTEAELQAGEAPVPLDTLVDIMARPLFELYADTDHGGRHAARLIGRSLVEPLPFMTKFLAEEFQPVMSRFGQALRRHAPTLSPEDFLWRLSFVVGAMLHALATLPRMKDLTRGICRDNDQAAARARFVQFAVRVFGPPESISQ
jgi:AcrR family transcriptional regulator